MSIFYCTKISISKIVVQKAEEEKYSFVAELFSSTPKNPSVKIYSK